MKRLLVFLFYSILLSEVCIAQVKKPLDIFHDDPSAREEYEYLRLRDPATNQIPTLIAQKEFEFASKLPKHDPFGGKYTTMQSIDWQSIGPQNQSGRVQAFAIDILNGANMLTGTASGGVWRSIDSGGSWVKVTLPNDEQTISAIIQDTRPGKEATWYYSTGELLSTTGRRITSNIRTHSWGNGIYKSTDNGASWNPLLSTVTTSKHSAPINFTGIWNLALDKKNTEQDIIYAACYGGIMRSSDGGATWTNVLGGDVAVCFNSEIVIGSGGTLYAAIGSGYDGTLTPHQGVWRSTDGINWTKISTALLPKLIRRTRLALSEATDNVLYCLTEAPSDWTAADQIFVTNHTLSKYRYISGNGNGSGGSWEARTIPFDMNQNEYNNSLGGYCLTLAVHPKDTDQVFVGGNDLYYSENGFLDAGTKIGGYWFSSSPGPPRPLHPDIHTMMFAHNNPSRIFVGHDGGISYTYEYALGEADWYDISSGLSSSQIYHSAIDHATAGSDFILSGLQDNGSYGTSSSNPNDPWVSIWGGDGTTAAICNGGKLFFASSENGYIASFTLDNHDSVITYHGLFPLPSSSNDFLFYTNYILEPNETNQLYLSEYGKLWRYNSLTNIPNEFNQTLDVDWTEITEVQAALSPDQAFISAFGFAKNIQDRLFVGTNVGKLYQIDNVSTSPVLKDISGATFSTNSNIACIDVDPDNANEMMVVFSNYNIQSLFHTTDGGANWTAVGGNLEELPDGAGSGPSVRCAKIFHNGKDTIYYAGTSVGLYSTTKLNGAQTVWTQEAPTIIGNLIVENIEARQLDGRVVVSTQGGGVFKNVISSGVTGKNISENNILSVEQNYPNPFQNESKIRFTIGKASTVIIELYNALGEKLSVITNASFDEGTHTIDLSGKDLTAGNYFLRFSAEGNSATKMITIIK
jgi:hypothetical protein